MDKRLPVMEDYLRFRYLADPSVSGKRVAWTISHWDTEAPEGFRRFREEVHIAALENGRLEQERIITAGGSTEGCPWVQPDGSVYFLSDASRPVPMPEVGTIPLRLENEFFAQRQLYRWEGGNVKTCTHLRHGVQSFLPSPDGSRILLLSWRYGEEPKEELLRERTAQEINTALEERLQEPYITEAQRFKSDAEMGYCSHRKLELWLWEHGTLQLLSIQPFRAPCWMPDGKTILFQRSGENDLLEFYTMDVESGEIALLASLKNLSPCFEEHTPVITGGEILFCANTPGMEYSDPRGLYAIPLTGGEGLEAQRLVSEEADVDGVLSQDYNFVSRSTRKSEFCAMEDGRVYYATGVDGDVRIASVSFSERNSVPRMVTAPMENHHNLCPVDDTHLLTLCAPSDRLPELALVEIPSGKTTLLTDTNPWMNQVSLQQPQSLHTPSGTQGFYLPPVTHSPKSPVILYCHGGPTGFFSSALNYELQALAAAGFGVLYPNPRGGTGFGKSRGADHFAYDGAALSDIEEFTEHTCSLHPELDISRAGICGGSYGGFLTLYAAVHSTSFRAACAHRALANMHLIATASHSAGGHSREEFPNLIDCLLNRMDDSITPWTDRIQIPLQLLYSALDANCISAQADQIFAAVKSWSPQVPCEYILYPDSCHGLGFRGPMELAVHHKNANKRWFERYLL